jgi:hypothetical protein
MKLGRRQMYLPLCCEPRPALGIDTARRTHIFVYDPVEGFPTQRLRDSHRPSVKPEFLLQGNQKYGDCFSMLCRFFFFLLFFSLPSRLFFFFFFFFL